MQKPSLYSLQTCILQIRNFRERVMYFGYVALHFGTVRIAHNLSRTDKTSILAELFFIETVTRFKQILYLVCSGLL